MPVKNAVSAVALLVLLAADVAFAGCSWSGSFGCVNEEKYECNQYLNLKSTQSQFKVNLKSTSIQQVLSNGFSTDREGPRVTLSITPSQKKKTRTRDQLAEQIWAATMAHNLGTVLWRDVLLW